MELRKFISPEIIIGDDALLLAGRYAQNYIARKALIVTDEGVQKAGWTAKVEESLRKSGVDFVTFNGVHSNPRDFEVMEGVSLFREQGCDIIIAVGGGSPIDCAKGIGIVVANGAHINEYEGVDTIPEPIPPLICLPTTAGSAADISQFAIINNTDEGRKIAIISKSLVPDVSLIEPFVTTTKDAYLTASTAIDTLVHGIEAYVSNASSALSDINALEAIRLVYQNLLPCLQDPLNLLYRENLSLATIMAGKAFSNASLGLVHAMAHSLGAHCDAFHGEANALLLEEVIDFNFSSAKDRYTRIAKILIPELSCDEKEVKEILLSALREFRINAGLNSNLSKWCISHEDIVNLAQKALLDPCLATNPRVASQNDIISIYERATK